MISDGSREVGGVADIYGTVVELDGIAQARQLLNESDVMQDANRFLWVSPKDGANLVQKSVFTDRSASGKNTLETGGLGVVLGFNVGESNAIVTNTGPNPDETYNLFYHRHSIAIAMRGLPVPAGTPGVSAAVASDDGLTITVTKQWDTSFQSTVMVFRALYGTKTLDVNRAGIIRG